MVITDALLVTSACWSSRYAHARDLVVTNVKSPRTEAEGDCKWRELKLSQHIISCHHSSASELMRWGRDSTNIILLNELLTFEPCLMQKSKGLLDLLDLVIVNYVKSFLSINRPSLNLSSSSPITVVSVSPDCYENKRWSVGNPFYSHSSLNVVPRFPSPLREKNELHLFTLFFVHLG